MKPRTHCITLRLSSDVADAIENQAYEQGISQADWIRRAIRRALVTEHKTEIRQAKELSAMTGAA